MELFGEEEGLRKLNPVELPESLRGLEDNQQSGWLLALAIMLGTLTFGRFLLTFVVVVEAFEEIGALFNTT
jgi:hypothetical protein